MEHPAASSPSGSSSGQGFLRRAWQLLFGFDLRVGRGVYALVGFSLMAVKYAFDAWLIHGITKQTWMPWDYLSPLITRRMNVLPGPANEEYLWILIATTIPFLWIGASMTVRRARDSGLSPEFGLLFFVPLINYLVMLIFCFLPSRETLEPTPTPYSVRQPPRSQAAFLEGALLGALVGAAFATGMVLVSVMAFKTYGSSLFVGSPFVVGAVAAYVLERRAGPTTFHQAQIVAQAAVVLAGLAFLLFALEGVVCLLMAWPFAAVMAAVGAWIGRHVGQLPRRHGLRPVSPLWVLAIAWPFLMASDMRPSDAPLHSVSTTLHIAAPPEKVWQTMIDFPELPPPLQLIFSLGVAYPIRARLEGEGVGAVRYCEFSTGPFVEPITVWDPPHHLAFDVRSQPLPMRELSPYRMVDAPHLDGFLQSRKGEFRLIETEDGGTDMIGTTWYQVNIFPQFYWQLYADAIIHSIHERVLEHISETALAGDRQG